jgi:hypothetical protein
MKKSSASNAAWITTLLIFFAASAAMFAQTAPSTRAITFQAVTPDTSGVAKEYLASDRHCEISLYKDGSVHVWAYDPAMNGTDVQVKQFLFLRPKTETSHEYSRVQERVVTQKINDRYSIVSSDLGYDVFEARYQTAATRDLPADMQQAFHRTLEVDVSAAGNQ